LLLSVEKISAGVVFYGSRGAPATTMIINQNDQSVEAPRKE
jgi:hypothetical protein